MSPKELKDELQNILSGEKPFSGGDSIQAVAHYLRGSQASGKLAQTDKHYKAEETKRLIAYIDDQSRIRD
jgi:hypothetical protein